MSVSTFSLRKIPLLVLTVWSLNYKYFYHYFTGVKIRESDLHNIESRTGFDTRRPTLVVIHGWRNDFEAAVNDRIKNAVLKNNNINVLVVDWSPIASRNYIRAQGSVLAVGNYIGDVLLRLDEELNHKIHHITIVGHSLGAHISGDCAPLLLKMAS